jgi:HSP20 family protein
VQDSESQLLVQVDLPGHDPKAIQVRLEGDILTIQSERKQENQLGEKGSTRTERRYGTFARSFVLPKTVDTTRCEARYENGVLTLTLPKREEAKPRTVQIQVQS